MRQQEEARTIDASIHFVCACPHWPHYTLGYLGKSEGFMGMAPTSRSGGRHLQSRKRREGVNGDDKQGNASQS